MNILLIGSKGFIGGHVAAYFAKQHTVFTCDVVTDYTTENYFQINPTDAAFEDIFKAQAFDVCINCSGAASVPDSLLHPQRDYELNVHNTFKILESIRKHQASCKFIHISSAAVYGNPIRIPIKELDAIAPISPYGIHKKMAEDFCAYYQSFYSLSTLSLRLFSVYGPGLKKQLFWDLHKKCMSGDSIEIYGTGNESRDFIYVKDLVRVFELIIQKASFQGEVYNVANGIEISIREATEQFTQQLDWKGKLHFTQQQRLGDPINWCADITAIQEMGYQPKYSLAEGLQEYVVWLKENK